MSRPTIEKVEDNIIDWRTAMYSCIARSISSIRRKSSWSERFRFCAPYSMEPIYERTRSVDLLREQDLLIRQIAQYEALKIPRY